MVAAHRLQDTTGTWLPDAVDAGARICTSTKAEKILLESCEHVPLPWLRLSTHLALCQRICTAADYDHITDGVTSQFSDGQTAVGPLDFQCQPARARLIRGTTANIPSPCWAVECPKWYSPCLFQPFWFQAAKIAKMQAKD